MKITKECANPNCNNTFRTKSKRTISCSKRCSKIVGKIRTKKYRKKDKKKVREYNRKYYQKKKGAKND